MPKHGSEPTATDLDRRFMQAAFRLSRRHIGQTWPNPAVGALIVRDDGDGPVVVGRGWTAQGGRPHAEVRALDQAGALAQGATCYVTLEPCAHVGRTGPCCDALIEAGVGRVVSPIADPDVRVSGQGHARLSASGIELVMTADADQARILHAGHWTRIREGRPWICVKMAISADGFIGRIGEGNTKISGPEAHRIAHRMRADHDAILVGIGTMQADDPQLTCRLDGMADRSPVRVVLDTQARLSPGARMVETLDIAPVWVVVGESAPAKRTARLAEAGVVVIPAPVDGSGHIELRRVVMLLGERGLTTVLVEGGAKVARAFVDADLVDEAVLFRSQQIIGADGVPALDGLHAGLLMERPYKVIDQQPVGDDLKVHIRRQRN